MRASDRQHLILKQAVRFFAENGFEGQTRELARRIGIAHSALYRHFESKEALIEAVYNQVYLSRWNPEWAELITDRSRTLESRLTQFYLEYVVRVFDYDWVRIFVFAGLRTIDITGRYLLIVRRQVIRPACIEFRIEQGWPEREPIALSEREEELFWGLHGRIFYLAIRRFVYGTAIPEDLDPIVRDAVQSFFAGARAVMPTILEESSAGQASARKQAARRE